MLKVRVIPTLLWKDFGLVKGISFDSWRRVGSVLPAIKVYNRRDVDELILVDISASSEATSFDFESLNDFSNDCFLPLTAGGGITNVDDVQKFLESGADKISLNTFAYKKPELIEDIAKIFGSQCVVASIDVKKKDNSKWNCYSLSGTFDEQKDAIEWAREVESRGAGELLITSIDRDGTMSGYDLDLLRAIVDAVNIPVIGSGGAGNYQDIIDAALCGVSAVASASMYHFTEQTPAGAKTAMADAGIAIRENFVE